MKHRNRFPDLRSPLQVVPRLPLRIARGLIQTLSTSKSAMVIEDDSATVIEDDKPTQEPTPIQTRKRPLLKYMPRVPRILTAHRSAGRKSSKGEETPQLSDLIDHNIETIISLHMHAELKVGRHQRLLERLTALLGRPSFFYLTLVLIAAWIFTNLFGHYLRLPVFDPVPFSWLQGLIGLSALLMTILVLTTQNRQARFAERRKHLDLQVNLVVEHKVSKLIALVEELRRDMPTVRDRYDQEAEAMAEAVDPEAVFRALDETLAEMNPDEEQMIIESEITMDVETSVTTKSAHLSSSSAEE